MKTNETIGEIIANILRGIANKTIKIFCLNMTWKEVFAGNCQFIVFYDNWWFYIEIFNDCDDFDYVDFLITSGDCIYDYDSLNNLSDPGKMKNSWNYYISNDEWIDLSSKLNKALSEIPKLDINMIKEKP